MTPIKIKRILTPLDFSPASLKALDYAVILAKRTDAEITLLHVVENFYVTTDPFNSIAPRFDNYEKEINAISNENLNKAAGKLKEKGITKVKTLSVTGRTHNEIMRTAKKMKADIIVMGTHGVSGFQEFMIGSNAYRVVTDAPCPVLSVQKKNRAAGFKNILVPFSDRPHSREKVMYAIGLAELYGATLHVLGIDSEETKSHAKKISLEADQIKKIVEKHGLQCITKVKSAAYSDDTIFSYGKRINANLIVVTGDTTKENISEYFRGAVVKQLVNHSKVPVLTVPARYNPKMIELWQGI